tara:strand:+ start:20041 stop:20367 length:327 start_codon:yes stop_codon:yes gene_type:complete
MPRKTRSRRKYKGGSQMIEAKDAHEKKEEEELQELMGGKKGKTYKKGGKKEAKKGKTAKKGKKKMNEFFKLLLDAKKKNAESFVYKGKTYKKKVGTKKNPKLVVYKKA